MKRILSYVLTIAMMLSIIGGVAMTNTENVYARLGKDINGNPVENTNIYQPTDDPVYYYQPPVDENGNHDYFGYKIYDDPQEITDEEFFGKWDAIDNKWVITPYFKYSQYPAMSLVEENAKIGDYEAAKDELLAYYKSVQPERAAMYTTSVPQSYVRECLEGLSRNIYGYNMISAMNIGGFDLPANEFSTVEIPVHSSVVSGSIGSFTELSVEIASGDKYWTTAQIYTKDAANESVRPKLVANVNGIYTEFETTKDAVVVAGNSADNNFGFDEIAEIQEHGTYDNTDSSMGSYDENTRRLFIAFDISSLKSTDNVANMRIVLTGRNIITEDTKYKFADEDGNPYEGEADRDKLMWAVWYKDSAWQEDTITWNTTTVMDKMYFSCNDMEAWDYITSSGTGIKGKVCDFHRDNQLGYLRSAWMYYKDERYAYTYIRQEMALINSIGFETTVMNSLDMSTHANGLISSFYGFMESKYFTADVCTAWLKFLCQLADWQTYSYYGTSTNNWATFASGSVYNTCARFPELTPSDAWYEETLNEHDRTLSGFTFEDGMCIEMSHNYKSTILGTMNTPIAAMRNTGYKSPFNEELYEEIYDIVMSLVYTSGPYFGGFNTNDGYDPYTSYTSTFKTWYQNLFSDDEVLAYLISNGTSGSMPENPTTNYPLSHQTYMRSSWKEDSLQMSFIANTDSRASHYHNDALSVAMFAYGKYLLVDPGYGSDQTGDNGRVWTYNKSPVQHNLVTINDTYDYLYDGIVAATGLTRNSSSEKKFETNKNYDFIEYICTGYTSSPHMQRSVTFLKDQAFWIITDYDVPNDPTVENVFAQHWHLYPNANQEHDENYVVKTNYEDVNVMIVPVESEELDNLEYVDCYYSEKSGQKIVAEKAMYTKSKTGNGRFTTLIIPTDIGEKFKVETVALKNHSGIEDDLVNGAYFRITDDNTGDVNYYTFYHINDETAKPEDGVVIGDYVTDATTMLVQQNSNEEIVSVFVVDGSYIKSSLVGAEYIFKADDTTTVSYKKSGQFINVLSSLYDDAEDLTNMQIYMPSAKAAKLDGKSVTVNIEDGLVTFEGTYGSSNISSGGGGGGGGGAAVKPPADDKTDEEENNNNGEEDVTPVDPVEPTPATPSYDDVAESDWHYEYVEELTDKEIVSGDGTGSFAPNSNVTREQFLKMLLVAADVDAEEAENTFSDVLSDAWYKPYVLKAKNFGIVTGLSDTEFGIGANITRQDMAVMISRTIEKLGIEIDETEVEAFADDDKVSEYAKDGVTFMKSIGLIEGYNNEFRPLDNLTRAEAAKVISELLKLIEANK